MQKSKLIDLEQGSGWGLIRLNRPKALNALTLDMIQDMDQALRGWQSDSSVSTVLVEGAGDRAFCAGGDVKAIYEAGRRGELGSRDYVTDQFFREEYRLNALIAAYEKPIVSLWDGIVLGGGVGVSIMGRHRVGSEKLKFGMPETAIGFFPDVGGSYFMSRLGPIGRLLSLTGQTIGAGDAFALGLATDYIPSADTEAFKTAVQAKGLDAALAQHRQEPPGSEHVYALQDLANKHFNSWTAEDIFTSLAQDGSEQATKTLSTLEKRSPSAVKLTLRQLEKGQAMDFNTCLKMEFRICQQALRLPDFYEGIRAVLVDKDHKPNWSPVNLEGVTEAQVEAHFATLDLGELDF